MILRLRRLQRNVPHAHEILNDVAGAPLVLGSSMFIVTHTFIEPGASALFRVIRRDFIESLFSFIISVLWIRALNYSMMSVCNNRMMVCGLREIANYSHVYCCYSMPFLTTVAALQFCR